MGDRKGAYMVLVRRPEGRMPLEIPTLDGRIILKWSLKMWVGKWTGLILLRTGTGGGLS